VASRFADAAALSVIDHLVYGVPDLERGIRDVETLTGIRARYGGQHPRRGTHNALIALGCNCYLEIIAPDPNQPPPDSPRWFGIDELKESRLVAWAAKTADIDRVHHDAIIHGISVGEARSGTRQRSDGTLLSWRLTEPSSDPATNVLPFFIDWGSSPHPSRNAPQGANLVELCAEHPESERMQRSLRMLGLDMPVSHATQPTLIAVIDCPRGRVELR